MVSLTGVVFDKLALRTWFIYLEKFEPRTPVFYCVPVGQWNIR